MRIYLSGPMGAGKSTVGEALAARTGRPFVDLDARIAESAGKSVGAVFEEEGERRFRALERGEAARVVAESPADAVVALGGGTVTDFDARRMLLWDGLVVTLMGGVDTLTERVATQTGRPLLAGGSAAEVLTHLLDSRRAAYAECHAQIATDGASIDRVVDEVLGVEAAAPIVVPLGERTYRVEIGCGIRSRVAPAVRAATGGRVVVVTDETVEGLWAAEAVTMLEATGFEVITVVLPPGESAKHLSSVESIWDGALSSGVDRSGLVLAVGGGVVGDLAGFAAATLLRGVRFGQLPTTLLAMVDASVGGKTGFDRPEGKNLVGAFHQPSFVFCDIDTLSTLAPADRIAGLAEVVKSAWLAGESEVAALERDAEALRAGEPEATERAIRMAVRLKAQIVARDEREGGARRLLNLGHTVGHAYEAAAGYGEMRHGDAVARGMIAAFHVTRALGGGDSADEARARATALLSALGLPVDVAGRGSEEVLALLGADKKRHGDEVRFIAPGAPGEVEVIPVELSRLRALVAAI